MSAIILFKCRLCDGELTIPVSQTEQVTCPRCRANVSIFVSESIIKQNLVTTCVSCGHDTLYVQKDFSRHAGVAIVGLGVLVSLYFFARKQPILSMAALVVTAVVDFLAYRLVSDVTVCYSCHAIYRGFARNPVHEPFDLKKLEKYGGRAPRGSV